MEFIVRLVDAFAWPLTAVTLVLLLRHQVAEWLGDSRLHRVKAGPVELEWERGIAEVRAEVKGLAREQGASTKGKTIAVEVNDSLSISDDLKNAMIDAPIVAINESFERLVDRIAQRLRENGSTADLSNMGPIAVAALAQASGVIDEGTADVVQKLTVLRNLAVHGKVEMTAETAREFADLVAGLTVLT